MKSIIRLAVLAVIIILSASKASAWIGMPMPELRVEGRYLVDTHGNRVNLHGYAQTFSPWFNEQGTQWNNYNVSACLKYNKEKIDQILNVGWDINFVRMHMDPYWSNKPGVQTTGENDISAFDFDRFKRYLDEVFIPMAEYAVSKGLYVVMRPPGVCPENIAVGDEYHKYLIKVWSYVARQPRLKNHPNIMFELANEPINIKGTDGAFGNNGQPCFDALKDFFQQIVDAMRAEGCRNILWIPGLCWQMHYSGYANNPIEGENIGYAAHLYPGWFGSNSSFSEFQRGWNADVKPVADFAPVMITEMDWADQKYNASWGKAHTGVPYGEGNDNFGANFKLIMDESGNCSWLLFTGPEWLAKFKDVPGTPGNYNFLNDPEACPWPVYHWYKEYREQHNYPWADYARVHTSDKGDGTFLNPVIYGDFPDADVIRVGDTYYMLSTTMFLFPGATIMRSYDLVNWEYCANPIDYIELDDAYNLQNGQHRYARGMWASSLQYNPRDGKFYLLFNTLNDGAYLMTASDPEGEWTKRRLGQSFYDCGLLFDGDDTYIVHGNTNLSISKVDDDFKVVETKTVVNGNSDNAVEGSRLYHIGDYYYIYATYCGYPGKQTCFRSKDIFGDYEEKLIFDKNAIHQGALVDTPDGKWYTILHRDYFGGARVPYLLPVTFNGGWPRVAMMVSNIDNLTKPVGAPLHNTPRLATNDAFRNYLLGKQWQWNHNPDATRWSLVERAGFLRLRTATVTNNLYEARNTLTQRIIGYHADKAHNYGTVAFDISHMQDGDHAGLAIFQDPLAGIGVKIEGSRKIIYHYSASLSGKNGIVETDLSEIEGDVVYLRALVSLENTASAEFYYSTDNTTYNKVGQLFQLPYDLSVFIGNRFAIFNYATKALGGYVDVNWFSTEPVFAEDTFYPSDFESYSKESLTAVSLEVDADNLVVMTGSNVNLNVIARFEDGHSENVAPKVTYTVADPSVVSVRGGAIKGLCDGTTVVDIDYRDPLGNLLSLSVEVESTTFPLMTGLFNPSIWETGTFDEATSTVTTGQYGFAGWNYSNGVDLSGYKYLVAKVAKSPQAGGLSFRIFDENNYWAGCHSAPKSSASDCDYFLIDLRKAWKDDKSRKLDPSHIYYVGFWTYGHSPFVINEVYVTNDEDYLNPAGVTAITMDDADTPVDVYNLQGMMLKHGVTRAEAVGSLPSGIYIIGGSKVRIYR